MASPASGGGGAPFESREAAVAELRAAPVPSGDDDSDTVQAYLSLLQRAADRAEGKGVRVYGKEVAFLDHKSRANSDAGDVTPKEKLKLDLGFGTVTSYAFTYRASQTNLVLAATGPRVTFARTAEGRDHDSYPPGSRAREEARKAHADGLAEWHCVGVMISDRTLYIYDPNYPDYTTPKPGQAPQQGASQAPSGKDQLKDFNNLHRPREILRELTERSKGEKSYNLSGGVFIGGGGNDSGTCRTMSLAWMRFRVLVELGAAGELEEGERVEAEWHGLQRGSGLGAAKG